MENTSKRPKKYPYAVTDEQKMNLANIKFSQFLDSIPSDNENPVSVSNAEYQKLKNKFLEGLSKDIEFPIDKLKSMFDPAPEVTELRNQVESLSSKLREMEAFKSATSELLAILHGDGGHYESAHGTEKALKDAAELIHKKWVKNEHMKDINDLSALNKELVAALEATNEAFENYALRRKEKGSSTMKINTWNSLVFKIGELKSLLSKARKQ